MGLSTRARALREGLRRHWDCKHEREGEGEKDEKGDGKG